MLSFFMPLFSQTIYNKNQEILDLSKPQFLNASFLNLFFQLHAADLQGSFLYLYFISELVFNIFHLILARFFNRNEKLKKVWGRKS